MLAVKVSGPLRKLIGILNEPINYFLPIGEHKIALNELIGEMISIDFLQEIACIQCNRKTAKSFQQGYCYPCYRKLLECNLCLIHPEKCNYPKIDCPDTWEHEHCKQEHIVYLANSSGLKVGITRLSQIPTRWIDQGASQAIPLFKVNNRFHSGLVEVLFKKYIADKTNWRKMLGRDLDSYNMISVKAKLLQQAQPDLLLLASEYSEIESINDQATNLTYPISDYPMKLHNLTLDKEPKFSGKLLGIKGQYLLFDKGVMNIRKHNGYNVSFAV